MARKRDISPELWENEQLGMVPVEARLLFVACISIADDEGRLKGSARWLKGQAFRYDDTLAVADVQCWRDALIAAGLVCEYEDEGTEYLHLPTWSKWQSINRAYPSKLPPCPRHERSTSAHVVFTESSVNGHGTCDEHSLEAGTDTGVDAGTGTGSVPEAEAEESVASPPAALQAFHSTLAHLKGYEPSESFYLKVQAKYGHLDLEEEAFKIADWIRRHSKRPCSTGFVLNWLKRSSEERQTVNGSASSPARPSTSSRLSPEARAEIKNLYGS